MRTCLIVPIVIIWGTFVLASPACAQVDSASVREAATAGLQIVQTAARNYPNHRDCFSCHHQTLPLLAMGLADQKGLPIDHDLFREQGEFTAKSFESRREGLAEGKGAGAMAVSYGLWALYIAERMPDATTSAMVDFLLNRQSEDGSWSRSPHRPPLEESGFSVTILATYYMAQFATARQRPEVDEATERARSWILDTKPSSHEDCVSRLGALVLLEASEQEIDESRQHVIRLQQEDGGWGQVPGMASDAYVTGLTLFTLHRTGMPTTEETFQRGLQFLLDTQCEDGSWFVKTRSKPVQIYFDNGDPHGRSQFISIAATSWATAALSLALPPRHRDGAE